MEEQDLQRKVSGLLIVVLIFFLVKDYLYQEVPYNLDPFDEIFWKADALYSFRAVCVILVSWWLTYYLIIKKDLVWILSIIICLIMFLKPVILGPIKRQTSDDFFLEKQAAMEKMIKQDLPERSVSREIEKLGFEQVQHKGEYYIFIVHSLLDSAYGFVYVESGKEPEYLISGKPYLDRINGNWFYFHS